MVEGVNFELFLRCFCEVLRIKLFESANKFSEQKLLDVYLEIKKEH